MIDMDQLNFVLRANPLVILILLLFALLPKLMGQKCKEAVQ